MSFTHLHVHTEYSLLDGSAKIKELVARAKELGFDSIAMTDHGAMYGTIYFYRACLDAGIKPIIGCEVYVAPGSRFDREPGRNEEKYYHLILLAENNTGYMNLSKIVSTGFLEGYYYKPRVDKEILRKYHEGIICLSACLQGEVAFNLRYGFYDKAVSAAKEYEDIFGKGNYFLELQDHGLPEDKEINPGLVRMSRELDIPLVCTNDSHYIYKDDWKAHDVLICIQTGKKVGNEDRMHYAPGEYYLRSEEEMRALFPYAPEAVENTHKIAERCNVDITFGEYKIPHYDVPDGKDAFEYLKELCDKGIRERYGNPSPELLERLSHELSVIKNMGFVDYFLIVWDFINFSKENGIAVGPGRGSAAGSIVSYCLRITDIDPIRYNLLFERFLNPERVSMPDIDIDFDPDRRQEVIDYVRRKYGDERVVQIVTFGTLKPRNCIRDVGRVLDIPYNVCDKAAKSIPMDNKMTIDKALSVSTDFKKMYNEDSDVHKMVDYAKQLEGLPRHTGMHAAGVVIGSEPIINYIPLCKNNDVVTTQYEKGQVEELGLLKMDFLGLRNLTVIQDTVRSVEKRTGAKIDMSTLDMNDPKVFELISQGKCDGIFQLESQGMRNFMVDLSPGNLEDIIAGISLYRPGPMDFIPKYISGKKNPESVTYDTPELEEILAPTYGCIVYQEQVMQIVMQLAGYSMGRADLVRRAMSKKHSDTMLKERKNFVDGNAELGVKGCVGNGISRDTANKIFDEMVDFASYAFNKSHAAAYAVVAYQTAYLKYYYPLDYMASLLNSVKENSVKLNNYIRSVEKMNIKLLAPDINESDVEFAVSGKGIMYGLSAIKSVGESVVRGIIKERNENGLFKDFDDFIERMYNKSLNRRYVEAFILSGVFDSFGITRKALMMVYDDVIDNVARDRKKSISGQMDLFDIFEDESLKSKVKYPVVEEYTMDEKLAGEKEMLGVYVSGHPLLEYKQVIEKYTNAFTFDFTVDEETGEMNMTDGTICRIAGIIDSVKIILTKKNENMAFVTIEDMYGMLEVIVFPRTLTMYRGLLEEGSKVIISGRVSADEKEGKLIAETIEDIAVVQRDYNNRNKQLCVLFEDINDYRQKEEGFRKVLQAHKGGSKVLVQLRSERKLKWMNERINPDSDIVSVIGEMYGSDKVILRTVSDDK